MDNQSTDDEAAPRPPPRKWKNILRQNSERIGAFAEDAVLPKNQRRAHNVPVPEVELENVEVGPYRTTVIRKQPVKITAKHFPFFMIAVSVIQICIMYLCDNNIMTLLLGYDPHRRHEIWRYITDAMVHTGLSHLWSNMVLQMILGVLLEIVHHSKRISVIYFASVIGGSLFMTILSPKEYVVGASAGVYGLLCSHLSTILLNWNEMDWKRCRLFWLTFYISFNFTLELAIKDFNNRLAGHFGGAITGFLVSILVLKNFEKHPWEKKMQKICLAILIALFATIVIINIAAPIYLPTEWNFNYTSTLYVNTKKSKDLNEWYIDWSASMNMTPYAELIDKKVQICIMYLCDNNIMTLLLGYDPHRRHEIWRYITSHLSTILLNWNEMDWKRCRLFWLKFYISFNFTLELAIKDLNNRHAGHFGGAISGFLVSILVLKNFEKHPWEKKMQKICLMILIALFIFNYFPSDIDLTSSMCYLGCSNSREIRFSCEMEPWR